MEEQRKICPKCGAALHKDAAFCPRCANSVDSRTVVKPRLPWLRIGLCMGGLALVLLTAIAAGWIYLQPRTYEGAGEALYHDRDGDYQLVLSWIDTRLSPETEFSQYVEEGFEGRFPIAFFANDAESGDSVNARFMEKVDSFTAGFVPSEGGLDEISCTPPEADKEYVPDAALITFVDFVSQTGKSELLWTFHMKNGDTICLRTWVACEATPVYKIYPRDVPMDTAEDLQALIDGLGENKYLDGNVHIYLPPVTYDGDLSIDWRSVNLFGSTEGDRRTTFTGSVRVSATYNFGVGYFENIDFTGSGSGVGIATAYRLHLVNCRVSGWETGLLGYGGAWVNVNGCVFEDNGVGLHFNSTGNQVTHTLYYDNVFRNNDTAVLLERIPTDVTLDFGGTVFSGNGADIDNRCNQPLELSEAVFE